MSSFSKIKTLKKTFWQQYRTLVVNDVNPSNVIKKMKKTSVSPSISKEKLKDLKNATGLQISANYISWCQVDVTNSDCSILNWQCERVMDITHNTSIIDIIKMGVNIADAIPDSDAYVIEKLANKPQSKINMTMFQILIRQQQFISIILTQLFLRSKNKENDKSLESIYLMRSYAPAQFFNLFHGNEIVSASRVVETLLRQENADIKNIKSVFFDDELVRNYESSDKYTKQELSRGLLLTLTFLEDVLEQR